jgi:hypothetical protein
MTPTALRQLGSLMAAQKARDLARLERLVAEDRALEAEMAALGGLAAEDAASGHVLPPERQAARLAWADHRRALAARRRAALVPEIAAARAMAVRSLGRERALDHLAATADRIDTRLRGAREEREAPPLAPGAPDDEC